MTSTTRRVQPGSVIVAATPMEIAAVVHSDCIPALGQAQICDRLNEEAENGAAGIGDRFASADCVSCGAEISGFV